MTDASRLIEHAFSGRAILLAGQNLEPDMGRLLRQALAKELNLPVEATIAEACARLSDPTPLIAAIKREIAIRYRGE